MSIKRSCPVCHTGSNEADVFLAGNVDSERLTSFSYASRKLPEFMNHELVRCPTCDLVYADEPPDRSELASAYHVADYDSSDEATDAAVAYMSAMEPILAKISGRTSALEIGTGTAILLEHLKAVGFTQLVGVEPSTAAIEAAPAHRKPWILEGVFEDQAFAPNSFDLICCFMTMEHVLDPRFVAEAAYGLLRPGGAFVIVTHDYRSRVNRMLGARSPIIDIEHMQLFSEQSIRYLFEATGFGDVTVEPFSNRYTLRYWWRLVPVPSRVKSGIAQLSETLRVAQIKVRLNVGNAISAGFKGAV